VTNPVLSPVHFPKAEILPFENVEFEFTLDQLVVIAAQSRAFDLSSTPVLLWCIARTKRCRNF
jgi:hypothetical protein